MSTADWIASQYLLYLLFLC